MGYVKIVQYADITETYSYERKVPGNRKRSLSNIQKKRAKEIRKQRRNSSRSVYSIQRTRTSFFRLVHHNNHLATSITFLTLTFIQDVTYSQAQRYFARFFERLKRSVETDLPLSYISVKEKTKQGRIHYHVLMYNLPPSIPLTERETRFVQRKWGHGYADLRLASDKSPRIAGYMAKYLVKALKGYSYDERARFYNTSRNIAKIYNAGTNSLLNEGLDLHGDIEKVAQYDTIYLGRCDYIKSIKNQNDN